MRQHNVYCVCVTFSVVRYVGFSQGNDVGFISMGWSLTSDGNIQKTSIYWVACLEVIFVWPRRSSMVKCGWILGK